MVTIETVYLVQAYDQFNARWETPGNSPEEGLFPSASEAEDWIDQDITYWAGEAKSRADYRIEPLEVGVPYCEYCGVRPTCTHHIITPTSPQAE